VLSSAPVKRQRVEAATLPRPCALCLGMLEATCTNSIPVEVDITPARLTPDFFVATTTNASLSLKANEAERHHRRFECLDDGLKSIAAAWSFETFAIEISLPAAFAVRWKAAMWALQDAVVTQTDGSASSNSTKVGEPILDLFSKDWVRDAKETLRSALKDRIEASTGAKFDAQARFRISVACSAPLEMEEEASWLMDGNAHRQGRKSRRNRKGKMGVKQPALESLQASPSLLSRLDGISYEDFVARCPCSALTLTPPAAPVTLSLTPHRQPIYVGGRYCKLRRDLPQSPWIIDGQRRGFKDSSVDEEIAKVVAPPFLADGYNFLSSGREDADVRMLGSGRPFALEIRNSRVEALLPAHLESLAAAVTIGDAGVRVPRLAMVGAEALVSLKQGESEKRKSYTAICWIPRPVNDEDLNALNALSASGKQLALKQWTPVRVLHRRSNLERVRVVHDIRAEGFPGKDAPAGYFRLHLTTAAGLYVREFVHGDRGRTKPSVAEILGCRAECAYLDVTNVDMAWLDDVV
jgi:tRNA pseudouridine synthase 10